jgi:hypothetical protein
VEDESLGLGAGKRAGAALLQKVLSLDRLSFGGRAARRALSRRLLREARELGARASELDGEAAREIRREANEKFLLAVITRHGALVPDGGSSREGLGVEKRQTQVPPLDPVPEAPTRVFPSTSGLGQVDVTWDRPISDKQIVRYIVTAYGWLPDNTVVPATTHDVTGVDPAEPVTTKRIAGLTAINTYRFTVKAENADGFGSESLQTVPLIPGSNAPDAPTFAAGPILQAPAGTPNLQVGWVAPGAGTPVSAYLVTGYRETSAPGTFAMFDTRSVAAGQPLNALFPALVAGIYRFGVRSMGSGGFSGEALSPPPAYDLKVNLAPFKPPNLPTLSADEVLIFGREFTEAASTRKLMSEAVAVGNKWRYDYLKSQAIRAASDAMSYENYIADLMSMAISKASTAQLLVSPVLLGAIAELKDDIQDLRGVAGSSDVTSAIKEIADAATTAFMLEAMITWFVRYEPIQFWLGLFDKMIDDISAFDGGLPKTKRYLFAQFDDPLVGVGKAVADMATELRARLDSEVEDMAAPIRAAVDRVIAETSESLSSLFESFDGTLIMRPAGSPGLPDVPNSTPFARLQGQLTAAVDKLVQDLKSEVDAALAQTANLAPLCRNLMIAYVVLPLLAFLVIAVSGGPISAAALAAIVLVAVQELLHLLARWLTGPLLNKLDAAKAKLEGSTEVLRDVLARQALALDSPKDELDLVAAELLTLKNLVPELFLDSAADLLAHARRTVLENAVQLALGAQHALGMESGTAFDVLSPGYETDLYPAPKLPGGGHPQRLAGAALLRDLDALERRRIALRDGKEFEVTHRLSVFRLLGGTGDPTQAVGTALGAFANLISSGQAVIGLTGELLLDRQFPGTYRALIKDVRVSGLFNAALPAEDAVLGLPLTVAHLGISRTRIKRSANPFAPAIIGPDCLRSNLVADLQDRMAEVVDGVAARAIRELDCPPGAVNVMACLFDWTPTPPPHVLLGAQLRTKFLEQLPEAIERTINAMSCGLVETSWVRGVVTPLVSAADWSVISNCAVGWVGFFQCGWARPPEATLKNEITGLGLDASISAAIAAPAQTALNAALARYETEFAKWGDAYLREDPDPHIRSLGFATLERVQPMDFAVFNLLVSQTSGADRASSIGPMNGRLPVTPTATLQYGPFENRGLEGELLLSLGASKNVAQLADVILEVTFRACFDPDLAAAVRSSQAQRTVLDSIVASVAAARGKAVVLPGAMPEVRKTGTGRRTVHFSFRAHRDQLLLAALAAAKAEAVDPRALPNPVTVSGLSFDPGILPLARDPLTGLPRPYAPLRPGIEQLTLQFQKSRPLSLDELVAAIAVTPDDLGLDSAFLSSDDALLESLGIAVIPMDTGVPTDGNAGLTIAAATIDGLFVTQPAPRRPLLPAFGTANIFEGGTRLVMTTTGDPLPLKDLWNAATPAAITLDFNGGIGAQRLYDVILSLSFRVPSTSATLSLSAVTGVSS